MTVEPLGLCPTRRRLLVAVAGGSLALLGSTAVAARSRRPFGLGEVRDHIQLEKQPMSSPSPKSASPTAPGPLEVVAVNPGSVIVRWKPAFDDVRVVGQRVERDGSFHDDLSGDTVLYVDTRCEPASSHSYRVVALDADGNETPAASALRVDVPPAVLLDDFEGPLNQWTVKGLIRQDRTVCTGSQALQGTTVDGQTAATRSVVPSLRDLTCQIQVRYDEKDATGSFTVLKFKTPTSKPLCSLLVSPAGKLALRNGGSNVITVSRTRVAQRRWHAVSLTLSTLASGRTATISMDGSPVAALTDLPLDLGDAEVGMIQIGELARRRSYTLFLDRFVVWA